MIIFVMGLWVYSGFLACSQAPTNVIDQCLFFFTFFKPIIECSDAKVKKGRKNISCFFSAFCFRNDGMKETRLQYCFVNRFGSIFPVRTKTHKHIDPQREIPQPSFAHAHMMWMALKNLKGSVFTVHPDR